ncbi:MAG: hypothetical protein ACLSTO_00250 [Bilophila wadsworthia]
MSDLVSEDHILARIASHFPTKGRTCCSGAATTAPCSAFPGRCA